jgi:2Fe-2S ferredoxin
MIRINFIDTHEERHEVEASRAATLMQAAKEHDVPGILAVCGGACACATCHVIIAPEWAGRLPAAADPELQTLEFALNRETNSRLSCQIKVTPDLDGLVVRVASNE